MKFRRRLEQIEAIQYDGTNLAELTRAASEHHGAPVLLSEGVLLRKGSWLVLQARGAWGVLPNISFQRVYEPVPTARPRSCFHCEHYALGGPTGGRCNLYDESIRDEMDTAATCPSFEPERPWQEQRR